MEQVSRLFDEYMNHDPEFFRANYGGETQFGRTFVREEAVAGEDFAEILDYERITQLVKTAPLISVALCPCRHKNSHLGTACDKPQRTCISLNAGAESVIHAGIADRIDAREALRIIDECKTAGLAQVGDNVKKEIGFLCNCCACCCTLAKGVRTLGIGHAIMSSSWVAAVDTAKCVGCGKCTGSCMVHALDLEEVEDGGRTRKRVTYARDLCLGCGVCATLCRSGAIAMRPRDKKVFTPETTFHMVGRMAIERGKVADLLFDEPESLSFRALAQIVRLLEKSPPWKAAMSIKPLKSAFLNAVLKLADSGQ
jgi:NAD-dependent dihydropyrimidine dehydrogenase PreA subunit